MKQADFSLVLMILIVIIGCCLSLTAFLYAKQWEFEQLVEDEEKKADIHVRTLRQAFTSFGTILHSIGGLYNVYGRIERRDFSQFVNYQLANNVGIQALEWIPYVPAAQRLTVEEQIRHQTSGDFHFWQFSATGEMEAVTPRPAYYPVLHVEPLIENVHILGYDVGSDETLRITLEKSRDSGQLTTSGAIKIQTAQGELLGFRTFVPVYRRDSQPRTLTVEQRRQDIIGFAVGVFAFDELAQTILRLPKYRTNVVLQIRDSTPASRITELYAPLWFMRDDVTRSASKEIWSTQVEFGSREWKIILTILPDGLEFQMWYAWGILGIGLLFTLGLWRYMYIILTRARWAESLVAKRTQSLYTEIEARKQIAEALEESRQRFQAIFDEAATGIVQTDLIGKILDSNKAMQVLFDYSKEELQDRLLKELAHPEDAESDKPMLEKMLSGYYNSYATSKRYHDKYGNVVWTNQSCSIVRDTKNPFIISMIEDITERKCAEQARLEAEKKYRDIFENAVEGIFQCTPTGYFLSVNPAFVKMLGYSSAQQMLAEVTNIGQQLYVNPDQRLEFIKLLEKHSEVKGFEYEARCRDGQMIWVNETARVVRDEQGGIRYYESIVENVTERKLIEKKLRYDASHDPLTGLLNRAEFTSRLSKALARFHHAFEADSASHSQPMLGHASFVVLFIDLDRFKIVNDSMGHLVGDRLLTEVAERLKEQSSDYDSVARLGGDEFAMIMENLTDVPTLETRIEQIRTQLGLPYFIEGETFNTSASIGVAFASVNYSTANEILRDADTAMYEAKKRGRNKSVVFQTGMHNEVVNQLRMEADLRKAIERREFVLYYQPIVSLENRRTVGLEALIRWQHPEHGIIPPDKFIPLAEETGLIVEIGQWVFETACTQLRRWQLQFAHLAHLGMNINVSPIQLKHPRLVRQIQDIIERSGIHPSTCRVEITESAMMQDPNAALAMLNELKNLEVLLYIDDFGTGYSSLSYLQKFPIDGLKIDKSFIHEIDSPLSKMETTQAIIALGEAFKLRVVAEGVENDFQYQLLKECRCHHAQGYLFSKPKSSEDIENYLRSTVM